MPESRGLIGEAEVEDLDAPVSRRTGFRMEVGVHDAVLLRRGQSARDLERVVRSLAHRQRGREPLAKGHAVEQREDQVGRVLVRADIVDRDDVRMIERADGACLLLEAPRPLVVDPVAARHHLDRDVTAEPWIPAAIDLPHASRAEEGADLVGTDAVSRSTPRDLDRRRSRHLA
jgi:hypothetical protein